MSRFKTFIADGTAPYGRLYAGDLNAIQDRYADKEDFTQVVGVGTLEIGDNTLLLLKYGSGEIRLTGALRTDGIIRGLGGLFAGAYTTAQRDAIAAGLAPYGLIILNSTTNSLQWNRGTDEARNWSDLSSVTEMAQGILLFGLSANRPVASAANRYFYYHATDTGFLYQNQSGTAWATIVPGTVGGDLSGLLASPVVKKASTDFAILGTISPATITGDTNDYTPPGLATATTLRLGSSVPVNITGLSGGTDGKFLIIRNIGLAQITLKLESTLSQAQNRFVSPTDVTLAPRESRLVHYDVALSRWAILTTTPATDFIGCNLHASVGGIAPGATVTFPWIEDRDTNNFHAGTDNFVTIPALLGGTYDIDWSFNISGGAAWFTGRLEKNGSTVVSDGSNPRHVANLVVVPGDVLRLYYTNDTNQHDPYTHSVSAAYTMRRTSI